MALIDNGAYRQRGEQRMTKPLNIGLVGYGFMGRTHSNAYKRVNDFFDTGYRPVLKAVCGRDKEIRVGTTQHRSIGVWDPIH